MWILSTRKFFHSTRLDEGLAWFIRVDGFEILALAKLEYVIGKTIQQLHMRLNTTKNSSLIVWLPMERWDENVVGLDRIFATPAGDHIGMPRLTFTYWEPFAAWFMGYKKRQGWEYLKFSHKARSLICFIRGRRISRVVRWDHGDITNSLSWHQNLRSCKLSRECKFKYLCR
jgi:hypothetical protein